MNDVEQASQESNAAVMDALDLPDRVLLERASGVDLAGLGLPDAALAADRLAAHARLVAILGDGATDRIRMSPLGPAWSSDLDVAGVPDTVSLVAAGCICIDRFLERLGSKGSGRWLILDEGRVLGQADFGDAPGFAGVDRTIGRAVSRGRVELRDVLELRAARRGGAKLPRSEVTQAAAAIEAALGGDDLADCGHGRPSLEPVVLKVGSLRRKVSSIRRFARPRPIIALSGVDGAGKSSLTAAVFEDLRRFGLTADVVWARPGMRMDWIDPIVHRVRRSKGEAPTVARVAAGESVDASSRQGAVGWAWTTLVTATFLVDVWNRQLRRSGLKIYDRHLADALVTLDFVYDGVDLRVQRRLIQWLLPRSAVTFYLSIDAETAAARKPGDTFGQYAVEQQLLGYQRRLAERDDVVVLDATDDPQRLAATVLREMVRRVS